MKPACLPQTDYLDFDGYSATVSGWGVTDLDTKVQSATLQIVDVNIMDNNKCIDLYSEKWVSIYLIIFFFYLSF